MVLRNISFYSLKRGLSSPPLESGRIEQGLGWGMVVVGFAGGQCGERGWVQGCFLRSGVLGWEW